MLALTGIRTKVSGPGLDSLRSQRGAIIVANHQSLLDIPAMFKHCPPNLSFIAKKELASIPIFGWAAFIVGTIFIDRAKGAQNESLSDIVRHLQSGLNIFIFPEGTRSTTGRLAPFKRGAFVFAIQAQAPIVPVTIINSRERLPKKTWKISPGEIEIVVHSPIATTGLSPDHRHDLSAKVHGVIAESLKSRIS